MEEVPKSDDLVVRQARRNKFFAEGPSCSWSGQGRPFVLAFSFRMAAS